MTNKTGGPAFPYGTAFAGMTLRDYFAAKAMQGVLASGHYKGEFSATAMANSVYKMADEMLKAREK